MSDEPVLPPTDPEQDRELKELALISARLRPDHLAALYNRQSELYRSLKGKGVPRRTLAFIAGVSEKGVDYLAKRPPRKARKAPGAKATVSDQCHRCGLPTTVVRLDSAGLCPDCAFETMDQEE